MKKLFFVFTVIVLSTAFFNKSHAQFDAGADIVSSYIWRGSILADGPAVQPWLSYSIGEENVRLELGAWGSYTFFSTENGVEGAIRPSTEADLYVTLALGPISLTITDYYFPSADHGKLHPGGGYFDYQNMHTFEASLGAEFGGLSLLAAYNFAGARDLEGDGEDDPGIYFEGAYAFENGLSLVLGLGDEFYGATKRNGNATFGVVNVGVGYEKQIRGGLSAYSQVVLNPSAETFGIVFGIRF
jgi:hypothetical protein